MGEKPLMATVRQEVGRHRGRCMGCGEEQGLEAISDVGDRLVMICENCHKEYKGELPTEGIVHPH